MYAYRRVAGERRRHARARRPRNARRHACDAARRHRRPHDERHGRDLRPDAGRGAQARRRALVRPGPQHGPGPGRGRVRVARRAHRRPARAAGLSARRTSASRPWRRSCARSRDVPLNIEIKGRADTDSASFNRNADLLAEAAQPLGPHGHHRGLLPAGRGRALPSPGAAGPGRAGPHRDGPVLRGRAATHPGHRRDPAVAPVRRDRRGDPRLRVAARMPPATRCMSGSAGRRSPSASTARCSARASTG